MHSTMKPQYVYVNDNKKVIGGLVEKMKTPNGLFHADKAIVAIYQNSPVGILSMSNNASEIISLEVLPCYRRRGIATKLLSFAKKIALWHGQKNLKLTSMNNKSNSLYTKHGNKKPHSRDFTISLRKSI